LEAAGENCFFFFFFFFFLSLSLSFSPSLSISSLCDLTDGASYRLSELRSLKVSAHGRSNTNNSCGVVAC
jgi:hypothetical protein